MVGRLPGHDWIRPCDGEFGLSTQRRFRYHHLGQQLVGAILRRQTRKNGLNYYDTVTIYPSSNRFQTEPFGVQRIREFTERIKPDIVFINNDSWIVNHIYEQIKDLHAAQKFKVMAYIPMDSENWLSGLEILNKVDYVVSYTQFGAEEFLKAGCQKPIGVIHHGIDPTAFYPLDKKDCRKKLNIDENAFVVFNGNRNQGRKRQDVTIRAFAKFAKGKDDARLYLHCGLKDQGWDIIPLFNGAMVAEGNDPNGKLVLTSNTTQCPNVPVDLLRMIYATADVGINTSKGEGWGLVNHEHAACQVAQVVSNNTSSKEIFDGYGRCIDIEHIDVDMNFGRQMPVPSADHLASILEELYEDRKLLASYAKRCYDRALEAQFQWNTIALQFGQAFEEAAAQPWPVKEEPLPREEREPLPV